MTAEQPVALVTGSTRGIGLATARRLAADGHLVVVNGRTAADAERVAAEVEGYPLSYDVADESAVTEAFRTIFSEFKRLDALVNNAGVQEDALLGMVTKDVVARALETNVAGAIWHLRGAARLMMRAKRGSIVNVSSIMGVEGAAGQVVYASSKAALIGATKAAAKELAPAGIRVNAVAPGFIATDMTERLDEADMTRRLEAIDLGRAGTAEEVAHLIAFLTSDAAAYITGQVIGVDGGMTT